MSRRSFRWSLVAVAAVVSLLSACGSSNKPSTSNTTVASAGTSPTTAASPGANLNPSEPGLTASTIKIGMWWIDSTGACSKTHVTSGSAGCGTGDEQEYRSMTAYINAHGGVAGRQVIPVIYHTEFAGVTIAQGAQQACTYFTQDQPVSIVINQNSTPGNTIDCFIQHHIITINPSTYPYDNADYTADSPYLYAPDRPRPERWVLAYFNGLDAAGFFNGNVKIGVVRFNYPEYTSVYNSVLKPAMAAKGLTVSQDAVITAPTGVSSFGGLQTALQSTVLKFKAAGINRVMFLTDVGSVDLFWYPIAKSENFFPRYGLTSTQDMAVFIDMAPKGTFTGAVGVGWDPFYDVKPAQDPGGSQAAITCKGIMNNSGTPAGRNNKCDSLNFIQQVMNKAKSMGNITAPGFQAAAASLGTTFEPAEVFSTQFGPGLYDGPSSYRIYGYSAACNCFAYTGASQPMPETPVPGLS